MPMEDQIRELQSQIKKPVKAKKKKSKLDFKSVPVSSTPEEPGTAFMTQYPQAENEQQPDV